MTLNTILRYQRQTAMSYLEILRRAIKGGWVLDKMDTTQNTSDGEELIDITITHPRYGFYRVVTTKNDPTTSILTEYPETRKRVLKALAA